MSGRSVGECRFHPGNADTRNEEPLCRVRYYVIHRKSQPSPFDFDAPRNRAMLEGNSRAYLSRALMLHSWLYSEAERSCRGGIETRGSEFTPLDREGLLISTGNSARDSSRTMQSSGNAARTRAPFGINSPRHAEKLTSGSGFYRGWRGRAKD